MANGILSQLPSLTTVNDAIGSFSSSVDSLNYELPSNTDTLIAPLTSGLASLKEAIPSDPAAIVTPLKTAFENITSQLPSEELSVIDDFAAQFSQVLEILKPLQELLASEDGLSDLRDLVMEQGGDPTEILNSWIADFNSVVPPKSVEVLQTYIDTLSTFEQNLPSEPTEVAQYLANSFFGAPLNLLSAPLSVVNSFQTQITTLLSEESLQNFETHRQTAITQLTALANQFKTLDLTDAEAYTTIQTGLTTARTQLDSLPTHLTRLAGEFEAGLSALNPEGLGTDLQQALETVPEIAVAQVDNSLQLVLAPIQTLIQQLNDLTPEDLAQRLQDTKNYLDSVDAAQGVDAIRTSMLQPFITIGEAIASLDISQLQAAIADVLATFEEGITRITVATDGVKAAIQSALERLDAVLATVAQGGEKVETAIADVGTTIETAVASIPFDKLQDKFERLLQGVDSLMVEFGKKLDVLLSKIDEAIGRLETVDFGLVADPVLLAMRGLKSEIESIDRNTLSEVELTAFRTGALVLTNIDVGHLVDTEESGAEENGTIITTFDDVPIGALVGELVTKYEALTDQLASYNPSELLAPLEEPFDTVVNTLSQFDPAALFDKVLNSVESLKQLLASLERVLSQAIAPLSQFFDSLKNAMENFAPSKLLSPLTQQFDSLMALFETLDIAPFLDELEASYTQRMQQALEELQEVGNTFANAGDFKSYLDRETPDSEDKTLGSMPGDVLRAVDDVYGKIVAALEQIPEATLVAAFGELKQEFVRALETLSPLNLSAQITLSLQEQLARFDFTRQFDRVTELDRAYNELLLAFDRIDSVKVPTERQATYQHLAEIVPTLNPELILAPLRAQLQTLNEVTLTATASLDVAQLASAYAPVRDKVEAIVPAFLKEELTLTNIQAAFDTFNPARLADEVDLAYEQFALKTARFGDVLAAEIPPILQHLTASTTGFLPKLLKEAFSEVYDPLKAQLSALNPAVLVAELEAATYLPLMAVLEQLHPDILLAELDISTQTQTFINTIDDTADSLKQLQTTVSQQHRNILADLEELNPIRLAEESLKQAFQNIQLVTKLDPQKIISRLNRLMAIIRDDLVRVLKDVDAAHSQMLSAARAI